MKDDEKPKNGGVPLSAMEYYRIMK